MHATSTKSYVLHTTTPCETLNHRSPSPTDAPSSRRSSVTVQSKLSKESPRALRHPLRVVPPLAFNVAGGGPFVYFYRKDQQE